MASHRLKKPNSRVSACASLLVYKSLRARGRSSHRLLRHPWGTLGFKWLLFSSCRLQTPSVPCPLVSKLRGSQVVPTIHHRPATGSPNPVGCGPNSNPSPSLFSCLNQNLIHHTTGPAWLVPLNTNLPHCLLVFTQHNSFHHLDCQISKLVHSSSCLCWMCTLLCVHSTSLDLHAHQQPRLGA